MAEGRRKPQRSCLGCREVLDQDLLVRFVRAPDGQLLIDERQRLPGRGAYTCSKRECIAQALRKRQFDRTFKQPCQVVTVDELLTTLQSSLVGRMANLLGMARKASLAVSGSNAVLDALGRGADIALVIITLDVSSGIAEKVERRARAKQVLVIRLFNKAELGHIVGRAERSVLALPEGQLAAAFRNVWDRYQAILGEN